MTGDELQTLRLLIREEVGSAVYASEQRLGGRIDASEQHLGERIDASEQRLGERIDALSQEVDALERRVGQLEAVQRDMQMDLKELKLSHIEMKSTLTQVVSVLDEATAHIKEVRENQYMLERRMEERSGQFARQSQVLAKTLEEFTKDFASIIRELNQSIIAHENIPFDQAHRRPGSAA